MKTGVLLLNLGTPDAPTPAAIRPWLREFLSDRRVVDLPRALWLPILHGVILPLRPRRLAPMYARIWRADGSPLLAITREQRAALSARMPGVAVVVAEYCGYSGNTTTRVAPACFSCKRAARMSGRP